MSALLGSGMVKPDSQPPMLGTQAVVGAVRPRPTPAQAGSTGGAAAPRPRPPPPPPPPRPRPPSTPCGIALFSGRHPFAVVSELVEGPRIVPSSWRLL